MNVTVPDERWLDLWPPGRAPVELALWDLHSDPPIRAELVVMPYMGAASMAYRLRDLEGLQVVQLLTAGYDDVLAQLPDGVTLANAGGVHDASTAELALGLTIASLRGIGDFARAQSDGVWLHAERPALADRRVVLIGAGGVGEAVAARFAPFEVSLTRVASRARDGAHGRVHGVDELPRLLPVHDVVVLAVPLTEATRRLVDAAFLAAMPDGALLVNVARGPVVDTDALLAELSTGRLRAALDVTDPEPLPDGHPLWAMPNCLITPHVANTPEMGLALLAARVTANVTAYLDGRELVGLVDPDAGY